MYPIGEDIAKQINAKPDRHFWEQSWNSSIENTWPKLFHYRVGVILFFCLFAEAQTGGVYADEKLA